MSKKCVFKEQISAFLKFCKWVHGLSTGPCLFEIQREKHPDAAASWGAARSHSVLGAAMALQFVCAEIQNEDDAETSSCVAALDPRPQTHDFIATTMSVSVQTADQPEKNKMPDAPKQDA